MALPSDRKIWNFISKFTCCKVGPEDISLLYYVKSGKAIHVEDTDNMMAYAAIRQTSLEENGLQMTMAEFEQWLVAKGIRKVVRKRVKPSFSLYD